MRKKKLLGAISVLAGGQTAAYGISFVRNIVLARTLSQADFGLAAVFALAVGMMELTGKMAIGRQVVQDVSGGTQRFLNTAHTFQMIAALFSGGLLLSLCSPAAHLFKVPDKIWAFALLSLVPFMRGLENLDIHRRQRQLEFLPTVWVELIPQCIVTVLAYPLAIWIGNFHVVLLLILSKSVLTLAMTHILAQRKYRWGWDKSLAGGMWHFSWPLILNGMLMYVSQQGDKFLVGTGYPLEVLALYASCAMFISAPYMIMAHATGTIMLPLLSSVQKDSERFVIQYRNCMQACAVCSVAVMIPFIVGGEQILTIFFGPRYSGGGFLMAWLAAAYAYRLLRITPATAAMAHADTKNNLLTNLFRASALLPAALVIVSGGSITFVAVCMFFGEILAHTGSAWLLKKRLGIPVNIAFWASLYTGACLFLAGFLVYLGSGSWGFSMIAMASLFIEVVCLIVALLMFPENFKKLLILVQKTFVQKRF